MLTFEEVVLNSDKPVLVDFWNKRGGEEGVFGGVSVVMGWGFFCGLAISVEKWGRGGGEGVGGVWKWSFWWLRRLVSSS